MDKKYTCTMDQAADEVGIAVQMLRRMAREKVLTFAVAIPPEEGYTNWSYMVDRNALDECLAGKRDLFK